MIFMTGTFLKLMLIMGLKIITHNINHHYQLCGVKDLIIKNQIDIIFLQEISLTTENLQNFVHYLNYDAYVSLKPDNQPGVGVIFKKNFNSVHFVNIEPGFMLFCKFENTSFINIYAKSGNCGKNERRILFGDTLVNFVNKCDHKPILLGDFNCILDKKDCVLNADRKICHELKDFIRTMNYSDAFRILYPDKIEFTYFSAPATPSRLDRVYLPGELAGQLLSYEHFSSLSDHRGVYFILNFNLSEMSTEKVKKPTYFKLNVTILQDDDFLDNFTNLWSLCVNKIDNYENIALWWQEHFKPSCKKFLISYSKIVACGRNGFKDYLYASLDNSITNQNWQQVKVTKNIIKHVNNFDANGLILRAKDESCAREERGALYHLTREVKRAESTSLSSMLIGGVETADPALIESHIISFFSALYNGHHRSRPDQMEPVDTGVSFTADCDYLQPFLQHVGRIETDVADQLHQPLHIQELELAISQCKNGKSPGLDGISYEFYAKTFKTIGPTLLKVFQTMLDGGFLIDSMKEGVTKLIPKVTGVPKVTDLRPITLLSCEYKLLSKILVNRLNPVLSNFLTPSQLCGKQNQNILFGALELISCIDYVNTKNLNGYLISFDFFKAFDKCTISFTLTVMRKMGFSPTFINWIKNLHTDTNTCFILDNLTRKIFFSDNLRQGDPLASPLFLISIEPLLLVLNKRLTGLSIAGLRQKKLAYMDDVHGVFSSLDDLKIMNQTFNEFEMLSGMVLNKKKTKIIGLGGWADRQAWPLDYLVTSDEIKIYGLTFKNTVKESISVTWRGCVTKIRNYIYSWKNRFLPFLRQRVELLNIFALSKLWYFAQAFPIPKKDLIEIEKLVGDFVWQGRPERIALPEICAPVKEGGLGLQNLQARCDALLLRQITRILDVPCNARQHFMYWTSLSLRHAVPEILNNLKSEVTTPYFRHCVNLIYDQSLTNTVNMGTLHTFKAKDIYCDFNSTPPPPRVVFKHNIDFNTVWARLNSNVLTSQALDVMFCVTHDVYPNLERLQKCHFKKSNVCTYCRKGVENNLHLFVQCARVSKIWNFVRRCIALNSLLRNFSIESDFSILMLAANVSVDKEKAYVFLVSNYVLFIHLSLENESDFEINAFKSFLARNQCGKYDIILH